jgi:hypothetical protein
MAVQRVRRGWSPVGRKTLLTSHGYDSLLAFCPHKDKVCGQVVYGVTYPMLLFKT